MQSVAGSRAVIAVAAQGCAACGKQSDCGVGRLAAGGRTTLLEVPVAEPLATGEAVSFELSERRLLRAALTGYLLPTALLLLGAGLGEAAGGDAGSALGALAGLAVGILASRHARDHAAPILLKRG